MVRVSKTSFGLLEQYELFSYAAYQTVTATAKPTANLTSKPTVPVMR